MYFVLICAWLNILCISLAPVKTSAPTSGPYDLVVREFQSCADEGTGQIQFSNKISKSMSGKYVYNEPVVFGVPIDHDVRVKVEVQKWGNQGWRPRFMEYTIKNCEEFWKIGHISLESFFKSTGVPVTGCPIPAGNYTADNWEVGIEVKEIITVMPYGRLRGILSFFRNAAKVGCLAIIYDILPKPK